MNKHNLMKQIIEADDRYFNYGDSSFSDDEYDELKEQLRKIDPENPLFTMVGSNVNGDKTKLPFIMGSLNKVKPDNVKKWIEKHQGPHIVSEKLDGISFLTKIVDGEVIFAATRGDGEYGKVITDKAKIFIGDMVKNIKGMVFLRGESMLIGNTYKKLGFKNRRNGAAGILNKDGIKNSKYIVPYFYELILWSEKELNEIESFERMIKWGLKTPRYMTSSKLDVESLIDTYSIFKTEEYDIDGLVISCMKEKRENIMLPKNKVAFKINVGAVDAKVVEIEWNTSRTGRVIPVAIIEPINIGGVTVERVTAHNAEFVEKTKLGQGSVIKILRSGDVIPYINEVVSQCDNFELPMFCSNCNEMLKAKGVDLICDSDKCSTQSYKKVAHFLRTNGAENITDVTLEKLEIDTIEKCFELDEYDISFEEGFGMRSAQIIIDEIEKCLYTTPERLIASFGISNFGKRMSKLVIDSIKDKFDDNKKMIDYIFQMKPSELEKIHGIGNITAKYFSKNIKKFRDTLNYLYNAGLSFESKSKKFDGVKFALTGKGNFNRGEIVKLIENDGGIVGSVTKSTKYLVTSNIDSKSGKMKKAYKYGINIIDYEELMIMLKGE